MNHLITYLSFNGNCREAIEFYQDCFGGELYFQTLREFPKTEMLPELMKKHIVRAFLKNDNIFLIGTDLCDEKLVKGNAVSILLEDTNETRIKQYYKNLELGSTSIQPLQKIHWGNLFGSLIDKFGNHWLFYCKQLI